MEEIRRKVEAEFHGYVSIGSKGTLKVMVWRSITYYDVDTLVIADGHMNSERYIHVDVLDDHLWVVIAQHFIDRVH